MGRDFRRRDQGPPRPEEAIEVSSINITVIDREGNRTEGVEWKDYESLMEALTRHK